MEPRVYNVTRGDVWKGPVLKVRLAGHDFTGTLAKCQIRTTYSSPLLTEIILAPTFPALGEMDVQIEAPESETRNWPVDRDIVGDVEFSRTLPKFGPYTWFKFVIHVDPDVTRPR